MAENPNPIKRKIVPVKRGGKVIGEKEVFWFRVEARRPDGSRYQPYKQFDSYKEAKREYAKLVNEVDEGRFIAPSKKTLNQHLDDWLAGRRKVSEATKRNNRDALRPVRERLGERELLGLKKRDFDDLVTWMETQGRRRGGKAGTPLSPRSIQLTLNTAQQALDEKFLMDQWS